MAARAELKVCAWVEVAARVDRHEAPATDLVLGHGEDRPRLSACCAVERHQNAAGCESGSAIQATVEGDDGGLRANLH